MAIETLQVSATATPDNWTGATKATLVSDGLDATFINSGTSNNTQQQFAVTNSGLPSFAVISNVALKSRCQRGGSQNCTFTMTAVLGANFSAGGSKTSTSTITAFTDNFATKPGGGSWTVSDVNSLEIRIQNTQARDCRAMQFNIEVTYTADFTQAESAPPSESLSASGTSTQSENAPTSELLSSLGSFSQAETAPPSEDLTVSTEISLGEVAPPSESVSAEGSLSLAETTPNSESLAAEGSSSFDEIAPQSENLAVTTEISLAEIAPPSESLSASAESGFDEISPSSENLESIGSFGFDEILPNAEILITYGLIDMAETAPPSEDFSHEVSGGEPPVEPPPDVIFGGGSIGYSYGNEAFDESKLYRKFKLAHQIREEDKVLVEVIRTFLASQ